MEPRMRQDRPKSPLQSLRQALSTDQVDPRALEKASSSDFFEPSRSKSTPKSDFGRSWVDFGCPGGSIFVIFRCELARSGCFARRRSEEDATYKKPTKTLCFTSPNACQSFFVFCVQDSKVVEKSSQIRFSGESRDGSLSKRTFFDLRSVKRVPEGSSPGAP